jgi:hypothetical protein
VDVIREVVAMPGGKIECAFRGKAIQPSVVVRRQVVVGKVVQVIAPNHPEYRVELAVDHLVVPDLVELVKWRG